MSLCPIRSRRVARSTPRSSVVANVCLNPRLVPERVPAGVVEPEGVIAKLVGDPDLLPGLGAQALGEVSREAARWSPSVVRKSTWSIPMTILCLPASPCTCRMCRSPAGVGRFRPSSRRVTTDRIGRQWTVSRVLCRRPESAARTIRLGPPLPTGSSTLTRTPPRSRAVRAGHPQRRPYSSLLREGFTPPPVSRLSRVGSYPTFSPLPPRRSGGRPCLFCGTFPGVAPGGR